MSETIKIVERNISDLIEAEYNPRKLNTEQYGHIKSSLQRFGIVDPVLVNIHPDRKDIIIGGHQRTKVWRDLGNKTIPCVELSLDIEKEKELNVRLNKNTGEFDFEMLEEHFDMDSLLDWGFEEDDFDLSIDEPEAEEDDFEGELPDEPKTELGRIYQLGKHRLMCGDSTSEKDVALLMDGEKVNLWITDPPYNVAYEGKTNEAMTIENDDMGDEDFRKFLVDCYSVANSVMEEGASFYIWHSDKEAFNFRGVASDIGWQIRQCLIWVKNSLVMGQQDYHYKHEPCLYGWKDGKAHYWGSDRAQTSVLEFDRLGRCNLHPTMKPVKLFAYQIKNSSKINDIVLDSFGGSGTTIIACEESNRQARLMEFDPKYCDVIVERYCQLKGIDSESVFETGIAE